MTTEQAKALLHKFRMGLCTDEEAAAIGQWYTSLADKGVWTWSEEQKKAFDQMLRDRIGAEIAELPAHGTPTGAVVTPLRRRIPPWVSVAAAILLLLGMGGSYLWYRYSQPRKELAAHSMSSGRDIVPGRTQAILTLADGSRITLDSTQTGQLAVQGKMTVLNHNGAITYTGKTTPQILYNTLSTGRGEQSPPLTLSDGTKVWLDAASSIRFPVAFAGDRRTVEITGEAYFEVAPNAQMPFSVSVNGMTIDVLGTSFNINAYPDEEYMRTTLVSGSVKVSLDKEGKVLEPGQQAKVYIGSNPRHLPAGIRVDQGDIDQAVAWKNGMLDLGNVNIQEIMRQVSRWYDVDVVYKGDLQKAVYSGIFSRRDKVSTLLDILSATGSVHFSIDIDHKTIIVTP